MKLVINRCYGGFFISKDAAEFMAKRGNKRAQAELKQTGYFCGDGCSDLYTGGYDRTDPDLVAAVEELKTVANGHCSRLIVVEIPDDVEWEIEDDEGMESVHEKHRVWY